MGQIAPNLRAEHVEGVSVIDEQPGVVMLVQVASKPPREAFRKLVRRPGGARWLASGRLIVKSPGLRCRSDFFQPCGEPEHAAVPRRTVATGIAPHHSSQLAGHRQADAGAAMAAGCRVVGLFENVE